MQILIMRHGQADATANSDAERPLTEHGVKEAAMMGKWMASKGIVPSQIWVSPFLRAQQTYESLAKCLSLSNEQAAELTTTQAMITPSGSASQVRDLIDGYLAEHADSPTQVEILLIVSHMPLVSYLVSELTQHEFAPIFQTAGIAEIEYDVTRMMGYLNGVISPADLTS